MEKTDSIKSFVADFILLADKLSGETKDAEDRKIYRMYLTHAALILAKVEKGKSCEEDIINAEPLFDRSRPKDATAYDALHQIWSALTTLLTKPSFEGMSVNERLFAFGLFDQFDDAVSRRDFRMLRQILEKCMYEESEIKEIIEKEMGTG
ncbi:MAG: hypothetical protein ACMUIL_08420 [bacterium]